MAEAAVLTTLGWVASPFIKMLIDKAHDHLGTGISKRKKILEATVLPRLSLAIERAEKSSNKVRLEEWLKRLKDAYYDAEEAIDLFEYDKLKQKVKADRKKLQQKIKCENGTLFSSGLYIPRHLKFASDKLNNALSVFSRKKIMLKNRIDKLIEIAKEANEFRNLVEAQENSTSSHHRQNISKLLDRVFGREKDKDNIAVLLTENPSNSKPGPSTKEQPIPIITIMGRSGIGKTALAQYVYKCMEEKNQFDISLWVHVPRIFKADDVIKSMIEIIKARKGALHECNYDFSKPNLEALSNEIDIGMLRRKKVLLVLDDLWCDAQDFEEQWKSFIDCLGRWLPESRILLTTQSSAVASKACINHLTKVNVYKLNDLDGDEFIKLFMHHAWPSDCSEPKEEFEKIGKKIAVKLKGDPGAAKLVGHQLSEKVELSHWEKVADKEWLGDDMRARIWSYQQLPAHLQCCFTICSLLPRGTLFSKLWLIDLWITEGFIKPTHQEERMENIGEKCLDELVSRFFLEVTANNEWANIYLHDLFHDLAKQVRGDDFITTECVTCS
jgi:NB-ARC domain/Rx N-terminal domain